MPNQNPRRCVFGCYTKGVTVHDFPHPVKFPELFQAWIDIVGESLKNLTSDEIYRKKKVCHIHFTEKDWNRNNRLNALAVPSLHLPGATVLHAHRDHDYCKSEPMPLVQMASTSSTMDIPLQDITNLQSKSCSTDAAISVLHAPGDENRKCTTSVAVPIPMVNPQTTQITPTKEFDKEKRWLIYPNQEVIKCFYHIQHITTQYMKTSLRKKFLKQDIKIFTDIFADFPFNCEIHKNKLREYFENNVINVIICSWCKSINRILSGKIVYDGDDTIKVSAQLYHNKHKHLKNKK